MLRLIFIVLLALSLSACATMTKLTPEANHVRTSTNSAPKACKKLDAIKVKEDSGMLTAPSKQISAINMLKNQAAKLGANFVRITTDYSITKNGQYDPYSVMAVVIEGIAYRC